MSRRHPLTAIFNPTARRGNAYAGSQIGRAHTRPLATALETDTAGSAGSVGRQKRRTVGIAAETDSAIAVAHRFTRTIGVAPETDTAGVVTVGATPIGVALEVDSASTITAVQTAALIDLFDDIGIAWDDPDVS